jgi:hypothetical protein
MPKRAALVAPGHHPHRQSTWPESGKQSASKAPREGGAAPLPDPAGPKTLAVDLALSTDDDARWRALALSLPPTAQPPAAYPWYRLPTVPGIGKRLSLGRLYESLQIARFPRRRTWPRSAAASKVPRHQAANGGPLWQAERPRPSHVGLG